MHYPKELLSVSEGREAIAGIARDALFKRRSVSESVKILHPEIGQINTVISVACRNCGDGSNRVPVDLDGYSRGDKITEFQVKVPRVLSADDSILWDITHRKVRFGYRGYGLGTLGIETIEAAAKRSFADGVCADVCTSSYINPYKMRVWWDPVVQVDFLKLLRKMGYAPQDKESALLTDMIDAGEGFEFFQDGEGFAKAKPVNGDIVPKIVSDLKIVFCKMIG